MDTSTQHSDSPGLTTVPGFEVAACSADVRGLGDGRLDLALVRNNGPRFDAVALFTRNDVKAAPVLQGLKTLPGGVGQLEAILINSGNANACTGETGLQANEALLQGVANALRIDPARVLVCSTGRIGRQLPLERMSPRIPDLVEALSSSPEAGHAASRAILTSDTRPKTISLTADIGGTPVTLAGIAKGAGMIQPDMATMLAYIATDAAIGPDTLHALLSKVNQTTFNAITVDGDMSTNDTVVCLANGRSGLEIYDPESEAAAAFAGALHTACNYLAEAIVGDGEKISHVVEIQVEGAPSPQAADRVARAIGNSLLVKSSWYGADPNWGRILDAAGYARVGLREDLLELYYEDAPVYIRGQEQSANLDEWKSIVRRRRFTIRLNLNLGPGCARILSTDLTEAYVDFNKSE